jgi:hypothetical protein
MEKSPALACNALRGKSYKSPSVAMPGQNGAVIETNTEAAEQEPTHAR